MAIFFGTSANDDFTGTIGDDFFDTFGGSDQMAGKAGNDQMNGGAGNDVYDGGTGADYMFEEVSSIDWDVFLDTSSIGGETTEIWAGGGRDWIQCGSSNDIIHAGAGDDGFKNEYHWYFNKLISGAVGGGGGDDIIYGEDGNDQLKGQAGNDILHGGTGSDIVDGGSENNVMTGGTGNDIFSSETGADRATGNAGADFFNLGLGADIFVYTAVGDTGTADAARDRINGWDTSDIINLSWIDANPSFAGNQAFRWGGNDSTTDISEVSYFQTSDPMTGEAITLVGYNVGGIVHNIEVKGFWTFGTGDFVF